MRWEIALNWKHKNVSSCIFLMRAGIWFIKAISIKSHRIEFFPSLKQFKTQVYEFNFDRNKCVCVHVSSIIVGMFFNFNIQLSNQLAVWIPRKELGWSPRSTIMFLKIDSNESNFVLFSHYYQIKPTISVRYNEYIIGIENTIQSFNTVFK